ncbi:hypothetical protein BGZ96_003151 [Linnemannia gamsii]|uniref:F-box domain-containing protein n=1 Tax=Linnemannia gamsii TaxID=64522 RepID=A0ABQ7K850_9FUNG|nr:hypothetical protein BGZ96_003151 [Linnemannia gamsii]
MESASSRFFKLPELITLLASLLSKNDLSTLMRTSQQLHATCQPTFLREIDLVQTHRALCNNKDGFYALVRNADLIQSLTLNPKSGTQYYAYASMLDVWQDTNKGLSKSTPSSPRHVNMATSRKKIYSSFNFLYQLRSILGLSPRLAELYLHRVRIEQESWIHHLAKTISGIATLQTLHLTIFSAENLPAIIAPTIFFACPPMIRTLSIKTYSLRAGTYRATTGALNEEPPTPRQTPLHYLTDLTMAVEHRLQFSDILAILDHCPEIVSMNIPIIQPFSDREQAAAAILDLCPKLRNLSLHEHSDTISEQVLFAILGVMPKDTLQSFSYSLYRERMYNSLVVPLERHFDSLRSIKLIECIWIRPEQVQAILFTCSVLEVFVITEANDHELSITVGDLVEELWASTRIVELALVVNIGAIESPRYQRRRDFTEEEREQVSLFERFFRQLGSLAALRALCLSVLVSADVLDMESNPLAFRDYTFPGLLALGDDVDPEGRWGCLQELAGLKYLEVVRGSFNTDAWLPAGYEFEKQDVEYMAVHWPRLRSIEFVLPYHFVDTERDNLASHPYIRWLRNQLPQVKIAVLHNSTSGHVDEIKGVDFE